MDKRNLQTPNMIEPPIGELLEKVDSVYTLVMEVSKRARQLVDGAHNIAEAQSENPISIALEEIRKGLLTYLRTKVGIK